MEFYDTIKDLDWDDVTRSVYAKTDRDVRNALSKEMLTLEDFKALISPAAEPYLETMASMSRALTQKRFGKVMQFYVPMYLSNHCSNHCIYCGFNHNNKIARTTLNDSEIMEEINVNLGKCLALVHCNRHRVWGRLDVGGVEHDWLKGLNEEGQTVCTAASSVFAGA